MHDVPADARVLRRIAALGLAASLIAPVPAAAQTIMQQGPGPALVSPAWFQYQGTAVSGAVQAIAPSASDAGTMYIGGANGGVWRTTNGGASWQPMTDGQASLSIGALAINPTNADNVFAGIGRTSAALSRGGPFAGILLSSTGGQSWTSYGPAAFGLAAGTGPNIDAITYAGGSVIAGASERTFAGRLPGAVSGIFRIDPAGGASRIGTLSNAAAAADPSKPLPMDALVTGLATDPRNANIVYAAVAPMAGFTSLNGVYQSTDNGRSFTRILDATTDPVFGAAIARANNMRIAAGPDGTVYAVTSMPNGGSSGVDALLRRDPISGRWSALNVAPALLTATQSQVQLAFAVDPRNSGVIYIGTSPANVPGDNGGDPDQNPDQNQTQPSNLYRGVVDPGSGAIAWTDIGLVTVNPHADFRTISFDANGNVLLGSDGGFYRNTSVLTGGAWQPLMNGYVGGEMYGVAWNPVSQTLAGAFQDNGDSIQSRSGSLSWRQLLGADGTNVAINATTLRSQNQALLYATTQLMGFFQRFTLNAANEIVGPAIQLVPMVGDSTIQPAFAGKIALNVQDPTLLAIGGARVYVGRDDLTNPNAQTFDTLPNTLSVNLPVTDVAGSNTLSSNPGITALAFGTHEAAWKYALIAADFRGGQGALYLSPDITAPDAALASLDVTITLPQLPAVVFDPTHAGQFFAAGGRSVYLFNPTNCPLGGECTPHDLGTTLPATLSAVSAAEVIDNNGVRAIFAGGLSDVATGNGVGNIYVLEDDASGTWQNTAWRMFGQGLPNVSVVQLVYSYDDDLLAVATLGRGAWTIPDVTSYFASATRIVLGNANFDSVRADVFTDGNHASRPLIKIGTGTVTLTGSNSYSGGTFLNGGVLVVSRDANLGAATGGLTFNGGTLRNIAGFSSARSITLNDAGGTFDTQAPLLLSGALVGSGGLSKTGPDLLMLSGIGSYGGPTMVNAGTLAVFGSLGSGLTNVAPGALLGGSGTIGGSLINNGTVMPGPAIAGMTGFGTLRINGSYTQTSGATLQINFGANANDAVQASGAFHAGGTLVLNLVGKIRNTSAVIGSGSSLDGSFIPQIVPGPFLQQQIFYRGAQVVASVTRDFTAPAQTANQRAMGGVLNTGYSTASQGDLDAVFAALDNTGSAPNAALDQLAGASVGNASVSALLIQTMLAQSVEQRMADRRSGSGGNGADLSPARLSFASAGSFDLMATQVAQIASADDSAAAMAGRGISVWARGLGGFGNLGSNGNGPGLRFSGGGAMVGADTQVSENWLIGGSLAYVASNATAQSVGSTSNASNYQAALYGGWQADRLFVDAQAAYTHADYVSQRTLSFGGLSRLAQGNPASDAVTLASRAGLTLRGGRMLVEPSLGLDWYHVSRGAFSESGAGSAGLNVARQATDAVKPSVGVRVTAPFALSADLLAIPEARLRYYHDFGDGRIPVTASLIGIPGAAFTTQASYPGRDSVVAGVGVSAQRGRSIRLFIDYNVELANHLTAHTMTGGVRYSF